MQGFFVKVKPLGVALIISAMGGLTLLAVANRKLTSSEAGPKGAAPQVLIAAGSSVWNMSKTESAAGKIDIVPITSGLLQDGTALRITVENAGQWYNAVMVARPIPFAVAPGRHMSLRFFARSNGELPIRVVFAPSVSKIRQNGDVTNEERELDTIVNLDSEWKRISLPFDTRHPLSDERSVSLRVGSAVGVYEFSQLELVDVGQVVGTPATPTPPSIPGRNRKQGGNAGATAPVDAPAGTSPTNPVPDTATVPPKTPGVAADTSVPD